MSPASRMNQTTRILRGAFRGEAETWDGLLSDANGMHVRPGHVFAALDAAAGGPVVGGCVGGGTGMICHGFKGGIGAAPAATSSWRSRRPTVE